MPRGPGQPSKLTPETVEKLAESLRQGDTYAVACAGADITYSTFRNWMNKGEAAKQGAYFDFFGKMNTALMGGRRIMERRAFKESKPLEYLAVRFPEDWAKPDRSEIGGAIKVVVEWATPDNVSGHKDKTDEKEKKG